MAGNAAVLGLLGTSVQRCAGDAPDHECLECGRSSAVQRQDAGTPAGGGAPSGGSLSGGMSTGTTDAGTATQPQLTIARVGATDHTFISTDQIAFSAKVTGVPPTDAGTAAAQVSWTVHGVSANSGGGNPHTATNDASFSFKPNPTNRPTTGSRSPNPPIQYQVEAKVDSVHTAVDLEQDETDIIRQEYVDFGAGPPARGDITSPSNAGFNTGNYSLIADAGMANALSGTEGQFATLTQQAAPAAAPLPAQLPDGGTPPAPPPVPVPAVGIASGYRNPRRNVAVGSQFPVTSRHVWGDALDLTVAGANATLWGRLRQAGANAGNSVSICEHGAAQVACNAANVDHVHINW